MPRTWARSILRATVFLALYVGTAELLHGPPVFDQAVLWLPTGVAISGLWLLGAGYWPVITLGTVLLRMRHGIYFPYFVPSALGNPLEALAAVVLLRRLGFRQELGRLRDGLALIAAAALAPTVGATIGRLNHYLASDLMTYWAGWAGWWRMNALGVLVVVPLVLSWVSPPHRRPRRSTVLAAVALGLGALAVVAFLTSTDMDRNQSGMVLSYLALPVAMLAAVRFGVRGGATAGAVMVVLLTLGALHGYGPFGTGAPSATPPTLRALALQAVIAIVVATPMLLGAVIAERESALAAIAEQRERHQELLTSINRNLNEGLFRNSLEHGLMYVNTALARMLGYASADPLGGVRFESLFADAARADAVRTRLALHGQVLSEDVLLVRRDGSTLPALLSCTAVRGPDGRIQHWDGAISDITERTRLEGQLRQTQKLEALGKLAGGVAHDFNNLLTAIGGYADTLRRDLGEGTPERRYAEEIVRTSARAADLTHQLLAYSRRQRLEPRVLDLVEVVEHLGGMLRRLIGEDVHLVTSHSDGPAWVRVDRSQLEQVVLNLVLNARDAMPGGGTVTIATGPVEDALLRAHGLLEPAAGPLVGLSVMDDGVGMDAEVQARAFDPFFTTKEPGKGTGLGLSTVYGIVRQSGGLVWLESAPGTGTTVRVCLPRVAALPDAPAAPAPAAVSACASGTVLVVEDEAGVRRLISSTLRDAGLAVLEAEDGAHGMEVAAASREPLDLVVSDVVMPRMGGHEMVTRLVASRPGLRVLFVSGYSQQAPDPAAATPGAQFLQKPFTPTQLLERVRGCLASTGGAAPDAPRPAAS